MIPNQVAYGIWCECGQWLEDANGMLFWTINYGVAAAQLRKEGMPKGSIMVFGPDGRPIVPLFQTGPSERKAPPPITPDPETMGRRS